MLNNKQRQDVYRRYCAGDKPKEIAKTFKVHINTVYYILRSEKLYGDTSLRTSSRGRKKSLSPQDVERIITYVITADKPPTLKEIAEQLDLNVCLETVRKVLLSSGLSKGQLNAKESMLTTRSRVA